MSKIKVGGVIMLLLGVFTVWAFANPLVAKWIVLGFFVLNFLTYLVMKEKE
ncbi:hypothetical protein LCGC14_1932470 [marine sediment metagenome]|uniref:Uncharacterized protein n=1 Tax=marine sediment metagenome TaxID=412755 RepID=A0A0F9I1E5_9ZZZZ